MKQKKVYVLSGPPASGKSTWVRENVTKGAEWISRDNVRFSFLKDGEDYFAHEDEVFDTFINYINQTLENPDIHTIFIDATHVNRRSRNKTLSRVRKQNIAELNCVCFTTPLEVCIARNHLREGRAKVPQHAIENMFKSCVAPVAAEGFDHVYVVNENGEMKEVNV
jgi:predicted kinase